MWVSFDSVVAHVEEYDKEIRGRRYNLWSNTFTVALLKIPPKWKPSGHLFMDIGLKQWHCRMCSVPWWLSFRRTWVQTLVLAHLVVSSWTSNLIHLTKLHFAFSWMVIMMVCAFWGSTTVKWDDTHKVQCLAQNNSLQIRKYYYCVLFKMDEMDLFVLISGYLQIGMEKSKLQNSLYELINIKLCVH